MAYEVVQSGNTREGLEALLTRFRTDLPPKEQEDVLRQATDNPDMTSEELAARMRHKLNEYGQANGPSTGLNLNQQSINNEAAFLQGGYDPSVANAVSASVGVGADAQAVEQAAADFAREAARAITNGQSLNEVRTADPNLSLAAQQAIYEQVAQQQGTSLQEIEEKAAAAKAADMQAIQGAVFGLGGKDAQESQGAAHAPTFGNLLWGQTAATTEQPAQSANPYASLLAGIEISRELRVLNAGSQATASLADAGQLGTQFASQTEQRSLGDPFSLA